MYIYFNDLHNVIHLYSIYHYIFTYIKVHIYTYLYAYVYISPYIVDITWTSSSYMVLFMYGFMCFVPFLEDKGIFRCIFVDVNCKEPPSLKLVGEVEHWAIPKIFKMRCKEKTTKTAKTAKMPKTKHKNLSKLHPMEFLEVHFVQPS